MSPIQKVLDFPLIRYYLLAWQRITDYKGVSNRREYWWGILSASVAIGLVLFSSALLIQDPQILNIVFGVFVFVSKLQILPLSIRRLRDTGDIKNKKTDIIFYLLVIFSMLSLKGSALISFLKLIIGIFLLSLYTKSSKSPADPENIIEGQ
ncbi:DUF805 domain-containing protein [Prochlorococcus marinus]|uniref:DUF805 domain-containing protein n=1 Tax=Prochlorococcus marinus TaxID=1219 RepID=UPI00056A1B55|nr:DUF805 domain-containing protein [Prochlorococcus marinus]